MEQNILRYYEDISETSVELTADKSRFFSYASHTSLHSFVTDWAYGKVLERVCIDISDGNAVNGIAQVKDASRRYCLKITACMPDWRKYVNSVKITVNGAVVLDSDEVFFEQVNLGWPSQYFAIPEGLLKDGENEISVTCRNKSGGGLYLSELKLIGFPEIPDKTQVSAINYVKAGGKFAVAVSDYSRKFVGVKDCVNCTFNGNMYYGDLCVSVFTADGEGQTSAVVSFNDGDVCLYMPQAVINDDYFLFGTDGDDHRHDDSWENRFIIESVVMSGMGNFIQFRPRPLRNYYKIMSDAEYEKLFSLMEAFGFTYGLCGNGKDMENLVQKHKENFLGYHIHEPYWFFCAAQLYKDLCVKTHEIDGSELQRSKFFSESKQVYLDVLSRIQKKYAGNIGMNSSGAPSFLCVYEDSAGFERITIEPVSNINMLTGAVRTTSVKMWGAHVPTDWYFGVPVDIVKSNKYRLALQYLYLNGASYVYAENALYKTNAFERCDLESEHCRVNRKYQREFYDYITTHPRKGKLIVDKAFLYGRNEFIMWKVNDRMAELKEKDWDSNVWGKWDNSYHAAWNAAEAWLPISDKQNEFESPLNKKLFSGTPYGNVDIINAENDFSRYKTLAILGWNTMNDELLSRLKNFVAGGGNLVISYAQTNYTDNPTDERKFPGADALKDFVGVEFTGECALSENAIWNDGTVCRFTESKIAVNGIVSTAKIVCRDDNGNAVVYENNYGKGKVYFIALKDYVTTDADADVLRKALHIVGEKSEWTCDNNNASFTVRDDGEFFRIDVLNMNCLEGNCETFSVKRNGETLCKGTVVVGEIKHYDIEKKD